MVIYVSAGSESPIIIKMCGLDSMFKELIRVTYNCNTRRLCSYDTRSFTSFGYLAVMENLNNPSFISGIFFAALIG
jgi:hypothetical protein